MEENKRTEISALGKQELMNRIGAKIKALESVLWNGIEQVIITDSMTDRVHITQSALMLEGMQFNLHYFPLQHLGYKSVVEAITPIYAKNATPRQIMVTMGVSKRFSVEDVEAFFDGVAIAVHEYRIESVAADVTSSLTGLTLQLTAVGEVVREKLVTRNGAQPQDILCITGDLGAPYMGLHLLERESRALKNVTDPHPKFEGYNYLLRRQLRPEAPAEALHTLHEYDILPTAMIDLKEGLATDLKKLCEASHTGARVYLDRLPIASEVFKISEELHSDPVVAALYGGAEYRLLFTVPFSQREKITRVPGIETIGFLTPQERDVMLITPDGGEIPMSEPDYKK